MAARVTSRKPCSNKAFIVQSIFTALDGFDGCSGIEIGVGLGVK